MIRDVFVWVGRTLVAIPIGMILVVALFRIIPPAITPLMIYRLVNAPFTGHSFTVNHQWVSYDDVSPDVFRALITSEDKKFLSHGGVDWQSVERAKKVNAARIRRGKLPLGASTITMQTAKNVFLLPFRTMVRKAAEVVFTYMIEALWGKKRILEVYVNMIEWGDGIYGVECAAQTYFKKSAKELTRRESALLAAVVPNPRRFSAAQPSSYVRRRATTIAAGLGGRKIPK